LAGWIKAQPLSGNPARYSSDQTAGKAGRETLDEDRDSKAAVDILAQLMTNLSEKTNTVFDETSNLQMNEVKYKDLPLNPYTQDHRFGKDEFGYDEAGRPMFETGDFRFVFVLNGKKIDAKVYEKGVEKETITDIEKKGLTQKSIKKSRP
ncbi:MAG: hypothetical protein LBD29_02540, partial [Treponema sp.]|nr:hypothetical protein [Treponema sp.]